jgi:uncharacterized membrane protein YfcA
MESLTPLSSLWFLVFLVVLLGNVIQGMTGFGAALVAGPILAIFLDPKLVVVIVLVTGMGSLSLVGYHARRYIDLKWLLLLVSLAVLGLPLGSYLLVIAPSFVIRSLIAVVSIIFSTLLLLGYSKRFKREVLASCGFGFAGGVLNASVGMGGPPIVIFLANQGWPKEVFRATVALFFLIIAALCLISHLFTGVTVGHRLVVALSLVPAGIMGFYVGDAMFARLSSTLFIRLALSLILVTGLTSLATTLSSKL